jgi:hypothetical protein
MTRERPTPACAGKSDLFERIDAASHTEARALCLGRDGSPACPLLEACKGWRRDFQATHWNGGLHGTWHGSLFGAKNPVGRPRKEVAA